MIGKFSLAARLMARFTAGEMEVMRILWEHGELKPVSWIVTLKGLRFGL
jgi:predicted transcriptional regulator